MKQEKMRELFENLVREGGYTTDSFTPCLDKRIDESYGCVETQRRYDEFCNVFKIAVTQTASDPEFIQENATNLAKIVDRLESGEIEGKPGDLKNLGIILKLLSLSNVIATIKNAVSRKTFNVDLSTVFIPSNKLIDTITIDGHGPVPRVLLGNGDVIFPMAFDEYNGEKVAHLIFNKMDEGRVPGMGNVTKEMYGKSETGLVFTFTKAASIDVMIQALTMLKEKMNMFQSERPIDKLIQEVGEVAKRMADSCTGPVYDYREEPIDKK